MRYLLNHVMGSECKVEDFLDFMTDLNLKFDADYISENDVPELDRHLAAFEADPEGVIGEFFHFLSTAPSSLTDQAKNFIVSQNDDDEFTETETQFEMAQSVSRMGKQLDELARKLTKLAPWRYAYHSAVDVTQIWRTKDNEVIGDPTNRKVQIDAVPRTMVGIVTVEPSDGHPRTMLSVSSGEYKGAEEAREDYLIDLTRIYQIAFGTAGVNRPRGVSDAQVTASLYKVITAAVPLVYEICMMAHQLRKVGALDDPTGIYRVLAVVKKALNPEDYQEGQLGGWA